MLTLIALAFECCHFGITLANIVGLVSGHFVA